MAEGGADLGISWVVLVGIAVYTVIIFKFLQILISPDNDFYKNNTLQNYFFFIRYFNANFVEILNPN